MYLISIKPHAKTMNFQQGFTLVEFMIASTLSLIVVAALSVMLVNSSRTRDEIQKAHQQIENGRFAMEQLTDDIQLAGFYDVYDINTGISFKGEAVGSIPHPPYTNPDSNKAKPDPCLTTNADLIRGMPLHIQGYDAQSQAAVIAALTCISDWKAGTDVVVIRRASTCQNCTVVTGAPYFQASRCGGPAELGASPFNATARFRLDTNLGNLNRTDRDCSTGTPRRRFITRIYFIANNTEPDPLCDGPPDPVSCIPTLKRAELTTVDSAGNTVTLGFHIKPLVEGIENLQIEYGVDSLPSSADPVQDGDGTADGYTANPDTLAANGCTGNASDTDDLNRCYENWRDVMSVKIHVLARSTEFSPGHTDNKTYTLGSNADGSVFSIGPGAGNDVVLTTDERKFKRHLFQSTVRINNPAGYRL